MSTPVLVTTEYRGVFFGYADDMSGENVTLTKCRNCIYWGTDQGGFLGLAEKGPTEKARIGEMLTGEFLVKKVTSVSQVSPEAEQKWLSAPTHKQ